MVAHQLLPFVGDVGCKGCDPVEDEEDGEVFLCARFDLTPGVASYLRIKLHEVRQYYPDWYFTAIGVDKDHVHLHMEIPPRYSVSGVVNILRSNTSRALGAKFRFLDKVYWDRGGI